MAVSQSPAAYVTEVAAPEPVTELQRLHSPMPEPEPEAEVSP
jgi:hypothetical protein